MADMILNNERPNAFCLFFGARQEYLLSSLLLNIIMEILASEVRLKKRPQITDRF